MKDWDKAEQTVITLPKKNFYAAMFSFTIGGVLIGYLIGDILHITSMMC